MNRQVTDIVKAIREKTQMVPKVALTLGSGLGGFAAHINVETEISYRDLPGFPVSTAPGHDGRFIFGTIGEGDHAVPVVCMKGRIHFSHIRNMEHTGAGKFEECAHLSEDGSFDMFEIMKALYDIGFDGIMRPDHGRMIWGEQAMPGYGLYDRALGSQYLLGLWEALSKMPHTL